MTATIRTVLDLPDLPSHEASLPVPLSAVGRWRKGFRALRQGGVPGAQHSLGWHVYSKRLRGGAIEFGIRWSAGLVRKNGTGFVGRVYFDSLSVQLGGDEDLLLVPEARANSVYDVANAVHYVARGGGHVFPPRAILERRFLAVPRSWTPAQIADVVEKSMRFKSVVFPLPALMPNGWGPARERQPVVNRTWYSQLFRQGAQTARNLLASGAPGSVRLGPSGTWANMDLRVAAMGPWMPDGDNQAGAPAGYEIELAYGWPQVPEALELSAMAHECSMARNRVAWNDLDTGEQLGCHDWISSESGRPVISAVGLEMPFFLDGQRKYYPSLNSGPCAYQGIIEGYATEDGEHATRASDDAKFLGYSANDPMALDDLEALHENHRAMIFNDRADALPSLSAQVNAGWSKGLDGLPLGPTSPQGSVSWKDYQSLTRDTVVLTARPHKGTPRALRHWGWTLDLAVFRKDHAFCRKMVSAHLLAVDSCGVSFREYHTPYLPPGVQGAQMFHEMIDKAAVLRACRLLADPILTDAVLDTVRVWVAKVLLNPNCRDAKWLHRQRADGSEVDPIGPNDHGPERMYEHILCVLGLAALCEIDAGNMAEARYYLEAGLTVDMPHATLAQRLSWIKTKTADMSQYASYQAAIEALS